MSKLVQSMVAHPAGGNSTDASIVVLMDNGGEVRTDIPCAVLPKANLLLQIGTLRRMMRRLRPEIVHVHSFTPLLLALLTAPGSARIVRTIHNDYPYFTARDMKSRFKRKLEGMLHELRNATLVCISPAVAARMPWRNSTSHLVENGIDFEATKRLSEQSGVAPSEKPREALHIVTIGRLEAQKNYDLLLRAFALSSARSSRALCLWLVGTGSQLQQLQQLAAELGIAGAVKFCGYQNNPFPFVADADVYVSSSQYEGFNLALVEAMGLGLPAIATRSGGVTDSLQDERDLLLVEKHEPADLAAAIDRLASDATARAALAARGMTIVRQRYSMTSMLQAYTSVYRAALREH